jgi:hypothetical protein
MDASSVVQVYAIADLAMGGTIRRHKASAKRVVALPAAGVAFSQSAKIGVFSSDEANALFEIVLVRGSVGRRRSGVRTNARQSET